MAQTVYCDEAGFTGNNLLDREQPYFAFATVAMQPGEAARVVERVIGEYGIRGTELKFSKLAKFHRGTQAISFVLASCADTALASVLHKRYCLATLFFEHIFEPILAEQNSLFYTCGLHRFVSNLLYFEALADEGQAGAVLEAFQRVIREHDASAASTIFPTRGLDQEYSAVLRDIEAFFVIHREAIAKDIAEHSGDEPLYSWMLDLTLSSFYALLTMWGERYPGLVVYCDESKPLMDMRKTIDMMVGRTDKAEVYFEGKKQSLIFNLAEPVHYVSSRDHPGVQLADIFASALAYCMRAPGDDLARTWMKQLAKSITEFSVLPDPHIVDLREERAFVSALVLHELVDRSAKNVSLFDGMPAFIAAARRYHRIASQLADDGGHSADAPRTRPLSP